MCEEILEYQDGIDSKNTKESMYYELSDTKGQVDEILDIGVCPNCGKDLTNGLCEDYSDCGYGHGDHEMEKRIYNKLMKDYDKSISGKKKSESLEGNGKKKQVIVMGLGRNIIYYDFHGRINQTEGLLEFEDKGSRYIMKVSYKTRFVKDITSSKNNGKTIISGVDLLDYEFGDENHKICLKVGKEWKPYYYDYLDAEKVAKSILEETGINKFL